MMTIWAFAVPIFEAPDEPLHWANSQYIYAHRSLPPYDETYLEGNQAPLYYLLIAPFASSSASPQILMAQTKSGTTLSCPPRFFEDCPKDLHRYWAIRRGRLASITIGLAGIVFTGLCVWELSQSLWIACLAAALIGLLPQFDFRAASINNDVAAASFSAMALYFIVRMVARTYNTKVAIAAAVSVALAVLSKINAGVMLPFFCGAILLTSGPLFQRVRRFWLLLIPACLMLPWALRNESLYGDLLGLAAMPGRVPMYVTRRALSDPYFRTTLPALGWRSVIGYFGWMNILSPDFVYNVYRLIFFLGLIGLIWWIWRHAANRRLILLIISIPVMSLGLFVYFNLTLTQPQGRLLFPALSATAVLLSLGLSALKPTRSYLTIALIAICLFMNGFILRKIIIPAYWSPVGNAVLADVGLPDTLMNGGPLGPLTQTHLFTQSFVAKHNNLSGADIEVAAYGGGIAHGFLKLSIADHEGGEPFAYREIPASVIPGCCVYEHIDFPPQPASAGKKYFLSLSTREVQLPDAITVFLSSGNVYEDGEAFLDGKGLGRDTSFHTFYSQGVFCGTCSS